MKIFDARIHVVEVVLESQLDRTEIALIFHVWTRALHKKKRAKERDSLEMDRRKNLSLVPLR